MSILCFLISFLKPNRYCVFRQSNDTSRSAGAHRIIKSSRASRLPTYLLSVRIGDVIISGTHTQTVSHFIWLPSFEGVLLGRRLFLTFCVDFEALRPRVGVSPTLWQARVGLHHRPRVQPWIAGDSGGARGAPGGRRRRTRFRTRRPPARMIATTRSRRLGTSARVGGLRIWDELTWPSP